MITYKIEKHRNMEDLIIEKCGWNYYLKKNNFWTTKFFIKNLNIFRTKIRLTIYLVRKNEKEWNDFSNFFFDSNV